MINLSELDIKMEEYHRQIENINNHAWKTTKQSDHKKTLKDFLSKINVVTTFKQRKNTQN